MFAYIFIVVTLFVLWMWNQGRRLPPGPWGLPIVGYLPWLDPQAPHLTLTKLSRKYGPIYGMYLGSVYTVVLSDHKLIRTVLAKDSTTGRAPLYLTHGIMKGNGLICAEKDLWKDQRKFVIGCLKQLGVSKISGRREKLEARIMREVDDLINYIESKEKSSSNEVTLDPADTLKHNLGSLINSLVFGVSYDRDDKLWKWLLHLQEEGTKHIGVAGPLNFLPFLRFIPKFKRPMTFLVDGQRETHGTYMKIIRNQAESLQKLRENDANYQVDNVLHAFLLEKEKRVGDVTEKFYSNEQFFHLLADLFGAGLDTTLTTLRWYLLYMANYPHIQKRVQEEIDQVIGSRRPCVEDLNNMPYTEASLAEIQRVRSVVPTGIPHGSLEEIEIEGFVIPKGSMIVPMQWAVHMNHDIWTDPEDFEPARFLNEEGRYVKDEALIPFQTGA
ncbi:cytochrome p450 [Holotrichia oblita]|uniref:Cytochrome p450 n=1 Tax=Holotrichia oblita TaxID=644536 RepID=A0ACB9T2N5_HOLOL|nr:cytochrome p450 [Holotrichia oblita]